MTTTVREAPAPLPLQGGLTDPAHPDASNEPVLEIDQIQGNIVPGFNKDHQTYLFLSIDDVDDFKAWLAYQVPFISTTAEVLTFNRLFKAIRDRRQVDSSAVKSTWMNIVFSSQGLGTIGTPTDGFDDEAFKDGLAARSLADLLGDPIGDADAPGNPANWVIGGPGDEADVVVIVAADDPDDLADETARITGSLMGATLIFQQDGATLPDPLRGHEQFGFLDGVSQPGVRGRVSNDPHDVLTPRQNPNNRDQGKPGQDVLWPGTFVFGYPSQQANPDGENLRLEDPGPLSSAGDGLDWTINGSFLVIRRLRQNVFALHSFLNETATDLGIPDPPMGVAADFVGSRLVGRWRSGAPVMRTPDQDDPDLALDDCANNNFEFQADTPPIPPTGSPSPFDCRDDQFPHSHKDPTGVRCPLTGHIRKVYPRDDESASGGPLPNEVAGGAPGLDPLRRPDRRRAPRAAGARVPHRPAGAVDRDRAGHPPGRGLRSAQRLGRAPDRGRRVPAGHSQARGRLSRVIVGEGRAGARWQTRLRGQRRHRTRFS